MRRTGNKITACSDYQSHLALKNLYLIIPEKSEYLSLILLQLNSKLFDFIHKSLTSGENKPFAQFPAHYIEKLPCKIDNALLYKADKLLKQIENLANSETTNIKVEKEIDFFVYNMYGLTEEEIQIVESF